MNTNIFALNNKLNNIKPAEKNLILLEAKKKQAIRGVTMIWLISIGSLLLRLFLEALGANPSSLFAGFIYLLSGFFLLPFWGIFPNSYEAPQSGRPMFDAHAFTAIFCYTVIALLAIIMILLLARMYKTGKQVEETVKKDNPIDPSKGEEIVK